jgi:hypothetical protein
MSWTQSDSFANFQDCKPDMSAMQIVNFYLLKTGIGHWLSGQRLKIRCRYP